MFAKISGTVIDSSLPVVAVMTSGGVAYEIELPLPAFCQIQIGDEVALWVHLIVREDALLLYGFLDKADKEAFRILIKVNGVGAKMALAILSTMSIDELADCVNCNNETALTRIAGVGKKTAQRLIIELSGKFDNHHANIVFDNTPQGATNQMQLISEVEMALISLGYKEKEVQSVIKSAKASIEGDTNTQTLLKLCLKILSRF